MQWNTFKRKKKGKYSVKNVFRRKLKRRDTCARLVRNKAIPKPTGLFLHNVFSKTEAAWSESWRRDQSGTTGRVLKVNIFLIRLCTSRSLLLFKRVIDISAVCGPGQELSVSQSIQQIVLCLSFVCSLTVRSITYFHNGHHISLHRHLWWRRPSSPQTFFLIFKIGTLYPHGINERFPFN